MKKQKSLAPNKNSLLKKNASPKISSYDAKNVNEGSTAIAGTPRTSARGRIPKIVYDPSDNYLSRGRRNSLPAFASRSALLAAAGMAPRKVPAAVPSMATLTISESNEASAVAATDGNIVQPVQSWTVDQVVSYVDKFYPDVSSILKSREIDGAALMILSREDILNDFGLKLGPALRLYQLFLGLQTDCKDITLSWAKD